MEDLDLAFCSCSIVMWMHASSGLTWSSSVWLCWGGKDTAGLPQHTKFKGLRLPCQVPNSTVLCLHRIRSVITAACKQDQQRFLCWDVMAPILLLAGEALQGVLTAFALLELGRSKVVR
jgi:hypothetical protein